MAETPWNITTTVQAICKQQKQNVSSLRDIPRNQLRIKESYGAGCLGEVIKHQHTNHIYNQVKISGIFDAKHTINRSFLFPRQGCIMRNRFRIFKYPSSCCCKIYI